MPVIVRPEVSAFVWVDLVSRMIKKKNALQTSFEIHKALHLLSGISPN
jgi:hypothetical protein